MAELISRRSIIAGGALSIGAALGSRTKRAQKHDEIPGMQWDRLDYAHGKIVALPAWPSDRQFSEDEWAAYVNLAAQLALSNPMCVYAALSSYMLMFRRYTPAPEQNNHWRMNVDPGPWYLIGSRIMILLRVMYTFPDVSDVEFEVSVPRTEWIFGCGGFPHKGAEPGYRVAGAPVGWDERGPRLIAYAREPRSQVLREYEPHIEYLWARESCELRPLDELLKRPVGPLLF